MTNKYLEKIATDLKEPASPESLGFDLSKGDEKELYKWMTAVTLFSRPIQRSVAGMAAKHMASQGFHSPEAVESAGWETLQDNLVQGHYGRFDESTATTMLAQARHLKEKYGTISNLIDKRTPEEIRAEIQSFRGIGPLGSQLFVEGINPYLEHIQKQASIDTYVRHKYVEGDWTQLEHPVASKKWDGAHFVLTVQPDGSLTYHSRRPSVKGGFPERSAQLPHLAKPMPEFAGNQFAVELVHTGLAKSETESHPTVSGILNSLPPRSIATQAEKGPVRAVLIDVKNPDLPTYKDKVEYIQKFEQAYGEPDLLFSPHLEHGVENINKYLDRIKEQKGEGLIVADYAKPETESVRYKVKNYVTYNLKVIGQQQEIDIKGNPKDSMGALILADASGRMVGKVGTGFDRDTRINTWKTPELFNEKLIQVKAYPPSVPGGQIRFPVYNGFADGDIDRVNL
jgi:hypothetical protein